MHASSRRQATKRLTRPISIGGTSVRSGSAGSQGLLAGRRQHLVGLERHGHGGRIPAALLGELSRDPRGVEDVPEARRALVPHVRVVHLLDAEQRHVADVVLVPVAAFAGEVEVDPVDDPGVDLGLDVLDAHEHPPGAGGGGGR